MKELDRLRAQANLESLAIQCVVGASICLSRDATISTDFDWKQVGKLAVDIAFAIRSQAIVVTQGMTDEQIANAANDLSEKQKKVH